MVSQTAMRGQRAAEAECRCWNPAVWLLVSLLGSLVLVAVSVLMRLGDVKMSKRDVPAFSANDMQSPVTTQYEVKLVNGRNSCEGRVEVRFNDTWGTVCDDDWDMVDANVVCRQLRCGVAVDVCSVSRFGRGTGLIALDNVDCRGDEVGLGQCRNLGWGVHNCYHYEDVAIICKEPHFLLPRGFAEPSTPSVVDSGIQDGTIRLVNGKSRCQGRVEIYYQGNWGTVCDDDWALNNAKVVCHQIGCGAAISALTNSFFGYGTGLIHLDNVNCYGNEPDLTKCKSLGWGKHNCGHHEDAGVNCTDITTVAPASTGTQAVSGTSFNTKVTETIPTTKLLTATTTTTAVTTTTTKATTVTATTKETGQSVIRLVNGNDICQGRVEVLYKTIWGTVCDDDWDITNANVVCRQVGCGPAIEAKDLAFFGYGSGPILLDNVDCNGSEMELSQCFHLGWGQHNCGHHEDAGVICEPFNPQLLLASAREFIIPEIIPVIPVTAQPSEGMLRLMEGQHRCEGRVELYLNSEWGTVCDDAWNLPDAQVVCRLVGCGEATKAWGNAYFGPGAGTIQLDNLKCNGNEASLLSCSHISWNVHNCNHSEDAGVTCSQS